MFGVSCCGHCCIRLRAKSPNSSSGGSTVSPAGVDAAAAVVGSSCNWFMSRSNGLKPVDCGEVAPSF